MSSTNDKAEEVLNKERCSKSSQYWGHNNLDDDEVFGTHWDSSSRRKKEKPRKDSQGDHHRRNNSSDSSTTNKSRPRSKNRRPDAAVYVPRARRSKDTVQPEVHENEVKDASTKLVEGESKCKPRRNKAGMEVYVPRPKRLQQSAETEKDKGNTFEEKQSNTFQNVESGRTAAGDSKELKKRRKVKEKKASSDTKDQGQKDTSKSKHETHRQSKHDQCEEKYLKAEPSDHEKHQEQFEDRNLDSDELQNNCANVDDETWEDEMKFYDSINNDHGEMNINVEDNPGANTKEMCLDQSTLAAENQGSKSTTSMETIDPSPVQPIAQEITGANNNLSVLDNMETDTSLAEGNNQICDQPIAVETLETDNCTLPKEMIQVKESDLNPCFSDRPEAEREANDLLSIADRTDSEEQQNKRRKEEPSGVYECDQKTDNKEQTKVDHNDTRTCDGETARDEGTVEVETFKQPIENEMDTEKSTSISTSSDSTQDIFVTNYDNMGTEITHEDIGPNDQMAQETKVAKDPDENQVSDSCPAEGEDGDTWDALFDDDGEALDPKLMEELTEAVGKVKVQTTQFDYYNYQPKDPDLDDDAYRHLIEIYDFPSELITRDLLAAFREYKDRGFDIKWVDDNHAIGIFSSTIAAQAVLGMKHPLMKVRPISQASRQTKVKAKKCAVFMEPYRPRPETTASVARSLVTGALGLKSNLTREQRDQERKKLKEAKEKRRQERQQKKDAWDGSFGKCAMDM